MQIYVVIGSDEDGAFIDSDCVFQSKDEASSKMTALMESGRYRNIIFSIASISLDQELRNDTAEAITYLADALKPLAEAAHEFVTCACSFEAKGGMATHPTIVIKEEN